MRLFIICALIFFLAGSRAIAYPLDQFNECVRSSESNKSILGVSQESIADFCDCALEKIIDEGKKVESSANECAKRSFL